MPQGTKTRKATIDACAGVTAERPVRAARDNGPVASTGILRVARGSAAATLSTFVALVSHVAGGGVVPTLVGVAVPLVLSLAVCTVLAGRRPTTTRLVVSVVASQFLFHVLFVVGVPTKISAVDGPVSGSTHAHSVVLTSSALHAHPAEHVMWWAHAVAAVVTIIALRRGERTVKRLLEVGRLVIARVASHHPGRARTIQPVAVRRVAHPAITVHVVALLARDGIESRSRRGPPVGLPAV